MSVNLDEMKEPTVAPKCPGDDIELEEYETRLGFLYDIAQKASSASEVSDLLKGIPYMIQQILNASASSLLLIDEEEKRFCLRVSQIDNSKILEETKLSLDSGIAGFVALKSKSVIVNDISLDENYNKGTDGVRELDTKSIIAAPIVRGPKVIGVLEMINKKAGDLFNDRDLGLLTYFTSTEAFILLVSMAATMINNFKLCQKIQNEYTSTVETLVSYADAKDPYAHGHSRRVKEYSMLAAKALKLSSEELRLIEFGALLHDIGKIGIDDRVLRKAGTLTTEEWYIIRKHALKGANIVRLIPNLEKITDIILYHHERWDGKGYPEGLKGEKIPLGARIIAVAEAFDTMTTDRAYRSAMSFDEAISELSNLSGKQFCPQVVEAFVTQLRGQKEVSVIREGRSAIENFLIQEIKEDAKEEGTGVSREEKPAPKEVVIQDIEKDVKQETISVNAGDSPTTGEAVIQDVEKDTKQETISANAGDNPATGMALKQLVPARPEDATENKGSNLLAEAVLIKSAEEGTKPGGLVANGEAKPAVAEIDVEKPVEAKPDVAEIKVEKPVEAKPDVAEIKVEKPEEAKPAIVEIKVEKPGEAVKNTNTQKLEEKAANRIAKKKAKREAAKAKKNKDTLKLNDNITLELYQENIQVEITPLISFKKMSQFKKSLLMVDGLRIMSESWSEDEGFIITLSLREPVALGRILQEMTDVEKVFQKGSRIVAVLKTSGETGGN